MKHLMLDLETLGTAPGCVVLYIGAAVFDDESDAVTAQLSVRVDVLSSLFAGLHADNDTLAWWRGQSEDAKAALVDGPAVDLSEALKTLTLFYKSNECERIWGNGPVADVAWIEAAYRAVSLKWPWTHRDVRDFRGVRELGDVSYDDVPFAGVQHRAVDDAIWQAEVTILALRKLRNWRATALSVTADDNNPEARRAAA